GRPRAAVGRRALARARAGGDAGDRRRRRGARAPGQDAAARRAVAQRGARPRRARLLHGEGRDPLLRRHRRPARSRRPRALGVLRPRRRRRTGTAASRTTRAAPAREARHNMSIPIEVVVLGLITGMTYALLGIGLVLVYKTSRVINFA